MRRGFDEAMAGKTAECDGGGHIPGTHYAGRQEFTGTLTGDYIDHGDPPWRWYLMTSLTNRPETTSTTPSGANPETSSSQARNRAETEVAMNKLDLARQTSCVLGAVLRRQAEAIPDAIYLMAGEEHYGFGRVNELANSYAAGLREFGVEAGDTVALFMGSSPECVFTTLGVNKLGAIWVPTNTDYRGEWLGESRRRPARAS